MAFLRIINYGDFLHLTMDSDKKTSILSVDEIRQKSTLDNNDAARLCDGKIFAALNQVIGEKQDHDSVFTLAARLAVEVLFNLAVSRDRSDLAAEASVAFLSIHENAIAINHSSRNVLIHTIVRCFYFHADEKKLLEILLSITLARFAGGPMTFTVSFNKKPSSPESEAPLPPVLEAESAPSESERQEEITEKCCALEQHLSQVMTLMESIHGSPTEDHNQNKIIEQGIWQKRGLSSIYYDISHLRDQLSEMRELSKSLKEDPEVLKILGKKE